MNDMSREMIDAFTASANMAASGITRINAELMNFGKTRFDTDAATAEALLGAKSMTDMLALQRDFMVAAFEAYAEETGKLRDMTIELTNEMVERVAKPLAG
jgi:hypothetical protein